MKKVVCCIMFALLSACANVGAPYMPVEKIPEGEAVVYFYAMPAYIGQAMQPEIYEADKKIVFLPYGGYYPYYVKPGEHTFIANMIFNDAQGRVTFNAQSGRSYYVSSYIIVSGKPRLALVSDKERALSEIRECKIVLEED